nr:zinc dependent phospholipase C family protein [Acetatifactor sp.]
MAYTMTHILVAEKVLQYFNFQIDYATYILGAIAPDAVHANPNYTPKLKEKSHFFVEGAKWGEITKESDFVEWLDSTKEFYLLNCSKYDRDFFLGYIVHVLTDICSCREIYAPFY